MNSQIHARLILFGRIDQQWIPNLVDMVEWTNPRYYHQN